MHQTEKGSLIMPLDRSIMTEEMDKQDKAVYTRVVASIRRVEIRGT